MPFPIAYIAGSFPARSETFVYREVRELRRRGWDLRTVSLNDPKEPGLAEFADLETQNFIVYNSGASATFGVALAEWLTHPMRSFGTWFTAMRDAVWPDEPIRFSSRIKLVAQSLAAIGIARRLRDAGVKHIHAHFAHAPASVAMYAAVQLGVPFSFTGHANDLFQRRALLKKKLQRACFVACISEWHRDFYVSNGADATKCHVIRCGVPVEEFVPRELNHHRQRIHLLTVCRLVEKKGVDTLVRALKQLGGSAERDWRLRIAGDGPESDKLKALAAELGVADRCGFLGAVTNDRVRDLLGEADYFVLSCRKDSAGDQDGIPVVLMEAMASGVPVISGDLPAIRELIVHGESGMLVDGTKPQEVADALTMLDRDRALQSRVRCGGRKRVGTEFSLEENVTRLEKLLQHGHHSRAIG